LKTTFDHLSDYFLLNKLLLNPCIDACAQTQSALTSRFYHCLEGASGDCYRSSAAAFGDGTAAGTHDLTSLTGNTGPEERQGFEVWPCRYRFKLPMGHLYDLGTLGQNLLSVELNAR
jgi:hypothetical protein